MKIRLGWILLIISSILIAAVILNGCSISSSTTSSSSSSSSQLPNGTLTVQITNAAGINGTNIYFGVCDVLYYPTNSANMFSGGSMTIASGNGSSTALNAVISGSVTNYSNTVFTGGNLYNLFIWADMDSSGYANATVGDMYCISLSNLINGNTTLTIDYATFLTFHTN